MALALGHPVGHPGRFSYALSEIYIDDIVVSAASDPNPVPEPSTAAMLLTSALLLASVARKKRSAYREYHS